MRVTSGFGENNVELPHQRKKKEEYTRTHFQTYVDRFVYMKKTILQCHVFGELCTGGKVFLRDNCVLQNAYLK